MNHLCKNEFVPNLMVCINLPNKSPFLAGGLLGIII